MLRINIKKRLGDFHLRPILEASDDELVVLLGHSGSGKSLTLRAIAGLLKPDAGRIELPDGPVFDAAQSIDLVPQQRNVGYVVQDLALFPHLTVAENLAFALHQQPKRQQRERVGELVKLLRLEGLEGRLPRNISGGQQQRVALGRALAARPRVLLLDEPFTALDAAVRGDLRREVANLRRQLGIAALFVTHDLQEAFAMADRIAVYDAGEVLQCAPRGDIFRRPASVRVAELLDARNIFPGRVVNTSDAFVEVETQWFTGRARNDGTLAVGDAAALSVRPEHVIMLRPGRPHGNHDTVLDVRIMEEVASGNSYRLYMRLVGPDGLPRECQIESDISAHPYEVMGIGTQPDWQAALSLEQTVAIPL